MRLKAGKVFVVDSKGQVTLGTASCPISAASCRKVRMRLEVPRRPKAKPYGTAHLTIKPGQRRALRVTLSRQARRTLRHKRSLRTRIVVRSGTAKPIVRTVTLRRR